MIKMSEAQLRSLRWESVSGGHYESMGIEKVALVKKFPLLRDDMREAMVGFNGMLRGDFVRYFPPPAKGRPKPEPVLCRINGVSAAGLFILQEIDPSSVDEEPGLIPGPPKYCELASDFVQGSRII